MAIYRKISMSFWTDSKVTDNFTPEDRYFYLYLITNPHTNLCGCYEVSVRQMSIDLGYTADVVNNLISRFEKVHNLIRYSHETKEMLLLKWYKYQWTKSDKLKIPLTHGIQQIKEESFKEYLTNLYEGYGIDTVSIPYPYSIDTTVTASASVSFTEDISLSKNIDHKNIDYKGIVDKYNSICISYPRVCSLSEDRKKTIRARLKTYTIEDFQKLFEKAEQSTFLKGGNNRSWRATFDWLIKDSNMAKVLDGNFDDMKGGGMTKPTNRVARELEESYDMMREWLEESKAKEVGGNGDGT